MAQHKKKQQVEDQGESAPLWIISFADLVTLTLSFFVVLAAAGSQGSGSEGSGKGGRDPALERIAVAIRAAFSDLSADESAVLAANERFEDLLRQLQTLARRKGPKLRGDSDEQGIYGQHFRIRRIRDGMEITMGGPVFFDLLSDQINEGGRDGVAQLAEKLRGHRNMVEVRGHAGDQPAPADWTFEDAVDLSYRRARRVADELIRLGVEPRTLRVTAVGPNEAIAHGAGDPDRLAEDRRVEVIIRESVLDDFAAPPPAPPAVAAPATPPPGIPADDDTPRPRPAPGSIPAPASDASQPHANGSETASSPTGQ